MIVSAFPGTGKSHYHKLHPNTTRDSDSSQFDKSMFPQNYIAHIKEVEQNTEVVFVSSHSEVRAAMASAELDYILVYPERSLKDEYMARYRERGSPEAFLNLMDKNWDAFINSCESDLGASSHMILQPGEFLLERLLTE